MFNKLLGKVESTVQSTTQTIEKVKESSVVQEIIDKEKESQIVIPEYKGIKSFEDAKREKEEREREALRQRRDADGRSCLPKRAFIWLKRGRKFLIHVDSNFFYSNFDGWDTRESIGRELLTSFPSQCVSFDFSFRICQLRQL